MELMRAQEAAGSRARARVDKSGGTLVGSLCANCGARSWPGRAVCSRCGSDDVSEAPLPVVGTLTSYTTVWVPRAGLPTPYVLGQVDLGHGAAVFAHVRGLAADATVPCPVRTALADDAAAVPRFWFEPAS